MPLAPDDAADPLLHALQAAADALAAEPRAMPDPRFRQRARRQLLRGMAMPAQRPFRRPGRHRFGGRSLAGLAAALALFALIAVPVFARPIVAGFVDSATGTVDQVLGHEHHTRPAAPTPLPTPPAAGAARPTATSGANTAATSTIVPVATASTTLADRSATAAPAVVAASEHSAVTTERVATRAPIATRTAPGTAVASVDRDTGKGAATVVASHSRASVAAAVPQQLGGHGTPAARGGITQGENHGKATSAMQHQRPTPSPSPTSVPASPPSHGGAGPPGRNGGAGDAGGNHVDAAHGSGNTGGSHGHGGDGTRR